MAYVEAHAELKDHPKTKKAARALGVSKVAMIGHLLCLWWWCQSYAPDGDLSGFDAADIAEAAEWEGEPAAFVQALIGCGAKGGAGFLGVADEGLIVNDWLQYGGKLTVQREQAAARMRAMRARNNGVTQPLRVTNGNVTHALRGVTDIDQSTTTTTGKVGKVIPTHLPTVSAPEPTNGGTNGHSNGNGTHPTADTASVLAAHRGHGSADPHDAAPMEPDSDAEHSFALLVDREVGVDPIMARRLADAFPFDEILRHVFQARRDIAAGSINSFGILNNRLLRHTAAMVSTVDKQSPLYLRHCESPYAEYVADDAPVTAPAPARRTAQAKPAPEPGTAAAVWARLQQDYALTQPAGSMDNLIADSRVVAYDEDAGVFEIGLADASRLDWAQKKLSTQVGRKLAIITGRQAVGVKFVAVEVVE